MTVRRFRVGSNGLLIVVLALAGGGQAGSYLHLLTAHHAVCAQHGDLADVAAPDAAFAACSPREDALPALSVPQAVEPTDHHCLATAGRRESVALVVGDPVRHDVAISAILPRPVAEHSPRDADSILRFAPKHSPPTA